MNDIPLIFYIDGQPAAQDAVSNRLMRSVLISLLSWRRAKPDDVLPAGQKMGWWGDIYAVPAGDQIGSRLWLLSREKLTGNVQARVQEYAQEALQWLVDDGTAQAVTVTAERQGLDRLALGILIVRGNTSLNFRFADVWQYLTST